MGPTNKFDVERARQILLDLVSLGMATTCAKWKISDRTVQRYKARLIADQPLAAMIGLRTAQNELEWGMQRQLFLAEAISKLRQLVATATHEHMKDIVDGITAVGELDVAMTGLGFGTNERARPDREGPPPAADAEGSGTEEALNS